MWPVALGERSSALDRRRRLRRRGLRPGPLRGELGRDVHHAPLEEELAGADAVPESRDPVGRRRVRNAGGES